MIYWLSTVAGGRAGPHKFPAVENPLVLVTPGTGPAIVKQLVAMHKGRVWMTSKGLPGEGSTSYLTLPVYQTEEQA
jgi:signal transduction histidine kinase